MTNTPAPTPIEKAVSKEVARTSPSWIRRDYVIVGALAAILAVLSFVTIVSLRHVERSVKSLDVLEECFTPGTRCSNFSVESRKRNQEFAIKLSADSSLCVLLTSGAVNNEEIPFTAEAVEVYYNNCVRERTPPPPPPRPTP